MLRDFLAYAAGGPLPGGGASGGGCRRRPCRRMPAPAPRPAPTLGGAGRPRAAAARHGLVVHEDVGSSADPVDLAVEDPADRAGSLLAVESDGPQYAAMRTTRDRDRLRAEQLERLGWRHLRVWSTDVFRDPARDVVSHPRGRRGAGGPGR